MLDPGHRRRDHARSTPPTCTRRRERAHHRRSPRRERAPRRGPPRDQGRHPRGDERPTPGTAASTSWRRARRRCAASAPTASTSTSSPTVDAGAPGRDARRARRAVDAGKVRWIGASSFPAWMVMEALMASRPRPARVRQRAAALQPARPAHRERAGPAVRAVQPGDPAVVTDRRRDPRGPLRHRRHRARRLPRPRGPQARKRITEAALAWPPPSPRWRASAASRRRSSRCSGRRTSRASPRRSSGPRTMAQLDDALGGARPRPRRRRPRRVRHARCTRAARWSTSSTRPAGCTRRWI